MDNIQPSPPTSQEYRRYYRLQPKEEKEPKGHLEFNGRKVDLTVVNLSPGGLLCYINADETSVKKESFIAKIIIQKPNKKPVIYSGRVLRADILEESKSKFCAIEFVRYQNKVLTKGSKPLLPVAPANDVDRYYLHRFESIKFLDGPHSVKEEIQETEMLYNAFEDIAKRLPIEERWFFFEILDIMKSHQPEYPDALKMEFFRFCRGEDRSEFMSDPGISVGIFRWIKNLFHESVK